MPEITKIIGEVKNLEKAQGEAKIEVSKFKGQLEQEMKRLEADFGLKKLSDVEKEVDKLRTKLNKIDSLILEKYKELKDNYDVSQG
jgi:ribosome recycling factor